MLRNIVEWVVEFIVNRVANWIIGRGGWVRSFNSWLPVIRGQLLDSVYFRDKPHYL